MLNFLVNYPHVIMLVVWLCVAVILFLRYFKVWRFARISWTWILVGVVALHLVYAVLLTWGQYVEWGKMPFTKTLLAQPLPTPTPLAGALEWARPLFNQPGGYFAHMVFMKFYLNIIVLFALVGFFAMLLKLRAYYRPYNFQEGEVVAISVALLVAGWPGVIVLLPFGFTLAIVFSLASLLLFKTLRTYLAPAFLVLLPIVLVWGVPFLKATNLYTLLKL